MTLLYYGIVTFIYLTYYYEHSFKKLMIDLKIKNFGNVFVC